MRKKGSRLGKWLNGTTRAQRVRETTAPERQIGESQATTDEESLKEQFNINPVPAKAVEVEPQVDEGPGRAKDAAEDAVL
jgi:hypothetical protein